MEEEKFVPLEIIDKEYFEDDEFPDELGNKKAEMPNISIDDILSKEEKYE